MKNFSVLMYFLLALFLMTGLACFGQQKINHLIFNSTENIVGLDFNSEIEPTLFYTGIKANSTIGEGIAHVENEAGEIVFWVNSNGVYDSENLLMPGSEGILAHPSSTEIIVSPFPGHPGKYFIFYNNQLCSQLYFSLVDMNLRNRKGDVTRLNIPIEAGRDFAEGLEVVRIPCTEDYWLLAFECEKGLARFRVSEEGVMGYENIHQYNSSDITDSKYTGRGEMDYHHGKLGLALTYLNLVLIYDFDAETGLVPRPFTYAYGFNPSNNANQANGAYGIEFSPDGSKFYMTSLYNLDPFGNPAGPNLISYDLTTHGVGKEWTISNTNPDCNAQMEGLGHIELGKDGNLYVSQINSCQILVIENPNSNDPQFKKINVSTILSAGISDHIQSDFLEEELYVNATIKIEGDSFLCPGEQVTLYVESFNNGHSFQWYRNGLLMAEEKENSLTTTLAGRYNLALSNAIGCAEFSNTITIEDASLPEVALKNKYEGCAGLPLEIATGMDEADDYSFSWSNGANGPSASIGESGQYELVISNEYCAEAIPFEVLIHPKRSFNVPNVFTPNGDLKNEAFELKGLIHPVRLKIYNRWGELVYYSEDYQNTWKGENLKKGTYFYRIEPLNECDGIQMGWVLVL